MPRYPVMGILQKALLKAAEETGNQEFARQANAIEARTAAPPADDPTVLQAIDHAAVTAALDSPPQANERLKAAFLRHGKTINSR